VTPVRPPTQQPVFSQRPAQRRRRPRLPAANADAGATPPTSLPGTAGVPILVGKSEADATKLLHDAGLTTTVREQRSPLVREGEVLAQDPSPAPRSWPGSTVTITVGRGLIPSPKPQQKPQGVRVAQR